MLFAFINPVIAREQEKARGQDLISKVGQLTVRRKNKILQGKIKIELYIVMTDFYANP